MDWLTFTSNIVRDLATPVAAVVIVLLLLKHAPGFSQFVKSVKFKDFELVLREEFAKAKDAADAIIIQRGERKHTEVDADDRVLKLAGIDPGVAIFDIWRKIEEKTIRLMQHNGIVRFTTPDRFIEWLWKEGRVSTSEYQLYRRLKTIRNTVAHPYSADRLGLSISEVLEFKEFAELFSKRLEEIQAEPGYLNFPLPKNKAV